MAYKIQNFEWVRGSTQPMRFSFRRKVSENPDVFEGMPFSDARFTVWKGAKNGEFLFRYSVEAGDIIITDPAEGQIDFVVASDDTRACAQSNIDDPGKNRYELELRNGNSERVFILGTIAAVGGINDDIGEA